MENPLELAKDMCVIFCKQYCELTKQGPPPDDSPEIELVKKYCRCKCNGEN